MDENNTPCDSNIWKKKYIQGTRFTNGEYSIGCPNPSKFNVTVGDKEYVVCGVHKNMLQRYAKRMKKDFKATSR